MDYALPGIYGTQEFPAWHIPNDNPAKVLTGSDQSTVFRESKNVDGRGRAHSRLDG
jgi:hypothetical protein